MIKTSQDFINKNLWFFTRGLPNTKLLHKWIYTLDLKRINFYLKDVLDIRNFVVEHTHYTSDKEVYGVAEYWLQNENEVYNLLRNKKDDCDGVAQLTTSLLHSVGANVHLALGYYGESKYAMFCNHAYCILINEDDPDDPFIIETTGDDIINNLPKMSDIPQYTTLVSCNANGEYYLYDIWEDRYEETI